MLNNLRIMFVFSIFFGLMNAQSSIEGSVTDSNGNPLAGANVVVDGTSVGAASGADGTYQINIPSGTVEGQTVTLVTSYIGYKSQSANVDVPLSGSVTMNFSLEVDAIGLQAISVTALGFEANRDQQGSTSSSINAGDMTRSGESLMANSLAAKASNVIVNPSAGDPGASTSIKIRGANTISGTNQPLIIVDGIGLICTCLWRKQRNSGRYLDETIAWYERNYDLDREPIKRVGGKGDFGIPTKYVHEERLYVGEAGGLQDFMWGFGMRYAITSGVLAVSYTHLRAHETDS